MIPDRVMGLLGVLMLSLMAVGYTQSMGSPIGDYEGIGATVFPAGTLAAPSVAFGDGDTGFAEIADENLQISIGGAGEGYKIETVTYGGALLAGLSVDSPAMLNRNVSATEPGILAGSSDVNTGLGHPADDALGLVAGGIEGLSIAETGSAITTLEIQIPQGDPAGTCGIGELKIDTAGGTQELCYCRASNTWDCIDFTTTGGPKD